MKNRSQNVEVTEEVFEWYKEHFPSARQGMIRMLDSVHFFAKDNPVTEMFEDPATATEFMLSAWRSIYRSSMAQLKGVFTGKELMVFIDIHNGVMLSPQSYANNSLLHGLSDSISLEGVDEKWEVDAEAIKAKVRALPNILCFCLEIWSRGFWYGKEPEEGRDYTTYIKQLV
jgi:hypothetical protein